MIRKLICSAMLFGALHVYGQASSIRRVEPLNWWVGMHDPRVQVLVYGDQIAAWAPAISYPGVKLEQVHRVANPNYLFLDVVISPAAKAGEVPIVFSKDKQPAITYAYVLRSRNRLQKKAQGVTSKDFVYLVMPDRFANGDTTNDVVGALRETTLNRDSMYYRHGGDLRGLIGRLDYLEDLGVTAVWPTPLLTNDMEKASYHGYANTENYQIDPRFGTNNDYRLLAEKLHARGMKLIMDVVPNHVGLNHWTVLDPPMKDWTHQWDSYTNTTYKDQTIYDPYAAPSDRKKMQDGWFVPSMPDMNESSELVQNYIIQSHIWWIEFAGVDAFRIDTYPYNNLAFMGKWGQAIRDEYPTFTYFGETWVHGVANQAFFTQGRTMGQAIDTHLPGVTDFQLQYAITDALTGKNEWTGGVNNLYTTLATDFVYQDPFRNVVFLDNHDMSRYFSVLGEDIVKYKSAIAWLLTTRGIPQLYYGSEILMKNFSNPDGAVREDFKGGWTGDTVNKFEASGRTPAEQDFFDYVRKLANYRKQNLVLQTGRMMQYVPEDGIYVYFRYNDEKTVMVLMNTEGKARTVNPSRFGERIKEATSAGNIVTGERVDLQKLIALPAQTTILLEF